MTATSNFADRLFAAVDAKQSVVVAGLDPHLDRLPGPPTAETVVDFFGRLIACVAPHVVAVKPQAAFFEALGVAGWRAYAELVSRARAEGLLVIGDVKRGDIGSTSAAYARAHLGPGPLRSDAVTVNPYLGSDGVRPFVDSAREAGGGLFVLVKTSNPSSSEIQDRLVDQAPLYEQVGRLVVGWGRELVGACGYSAVGAVVGATHPDVAARMRAVLAGVPVLLPGYGAQGATAEDLRGWFDARGHGGVVPASRSLAFCWEDPDDWEGAVEAAAVEMKRALNAVR